MHLVEIVEQFITQHLYEPGAEEPLAEYLARKEDFEQPFLTAPTWSTETSIEVVAAANSIDQRALWENNRHPLERKRNPGTFLPSLRRLRTRLLIHQ